MAQYAEVIILPTLMFIKRTLDSGVLAGLKKENLARAVPLRSMVRLSILSLIIRMPIPITLAGGTQNIKSPKMLILTGMTNIGCRRSFSGKKITMR